MRELNPLETAVLGQMRRIVANISDSLTDLAARVREIPMVPGPDMADVLTQFCATIEQKADETIGPRP
jgi:hypothetical protein